MYYHILQTTKKNQALINMYKSENDAVESDYSNLRVELQNIHYTND